MKKDSPTPASATPQFLFGYKNKSGDIVIPAQFTFAGAFDNGLAPAQTGKVWGVIDTSGQWVTPPQFENIARVEGGLIVIRSGRKYGLSKLSGEELLPCQYEAIVSVGKNSIVVQESDKFAILDLGGTPVIDSLNFASKWSQGFAVAATESGVGLLNEQGQWLVKPQYDAIFDFAEGFAAFEKDGKAGYLDLTGKVVVAPVYQAAFDFSEGMARVQSDDKYGYINSEGKLVIPCVWGGPVGGSEQERELRSRFSSGFAEVTEFGKYNTGLLDTHGNWIEDGSKVLARRNQKPSIEFELFRETNPAWDKEQEAVELGPTFYKKLETFKAKLDSAMSKDKPALISAFKNIISQFAEKKLKFLDLMIYDGDDYGLRVYEDGEGEPTEFFPFKTISKLFENGVMEEPKTKKGVELLRDFYDTTSETILDWCVATWSEAGGTNFKIPAYIRPDDVIPYVDLKTGKRVNTVPSPA